MPQMGMAALHKAASHGYEKVVRTLLSEGAELEKRDDVSFLLCSNKTQRWWLHSHHLIGLMIPEMASGRCWL